MVDLFYNILYSTIKQFVPTKKYVNSYPIWYTSELIKLIKAKSKAHSKYKRFNTNIYYNEFSLLRKRVKALNKICYNKKN